MENFTYYAPTKVVFGKDTVTQTGALVREAGGTKVLVHYGSGSAVRSGLLARVLQSLDEAGVAHVELGGVQPNPRIALAREGIALCRAEGVDFLLAVGGGSVIDSAKAIGYGVPYDGDVWDFYSKKAVPAASLPLGCVLTIAAAGSEMSDSSVLTNEDGWLKRGCNSDVCRARFAVEDPTVTETLPPYQTACGCVDIMMHTMERYFTHDKGNTLRDAMAEALMRTMRDAALTLRDDPDDYEARANVMWASSLSHNGLMGGRGTGDWACHQLEHELGGMFDCAHGAGLAAIWPAWARAVLDEEPARFAQFAVNVMGVVPDEDAQTTALAGVRAIEHFYRSIGMPATLSELDITLTPAQVAELALKCTFFGTRTIGGFKQLDEAAIAAIYVAAR